MSTRHISSMFDLNTDMCLACGDGPTLEDARAACVKDAEERGYVPQVWLEVWRRAHHTEGQLETTSDIGSHVWDIASYALRRLETTDPRTKVGTLRSTGALPPLPAELGAELTERTTVGYLRDRLSYLASQVR